jgi:hypothetical protein
MTPFDSHSRDQLRQAYADAWAKHVARAPLTPLEALITDVVGVHPEYQAMLETAHAAVAFEPGHPSGAENPFLHMGLHIAVREQVAIDRPPGIRDLHRQLALRHGDAHGAEHVLMEALGETLWEAQRSGRPPDEGHYLMLARKRLDESGRH